MNAAEERIVRGVINDLSVGEIGTSLGDDGPADGRRLPVEWQGYTISLREPEERGNDERISIICKDEVRIIHPEKTVQLPEQFFRRARIEDQRSAITADGQGIPLAQRKKVASFDRKFQRG